MYQKNREHITDNSRSRPAQGIARSLIGSSIQPIRSFKNRVLSNENVVQKTIPVHQEVPLFREKLTLGRAELTYGRAELTLGRDVQEQRHTNIRYRNNVDFLNQNYDQTTIQQNKFREIRCYVSLTTNPSRFYSDDFIEVLKCLSNQTIAPDKIYLSLCAKYVRNFPDFKTNTEQIARIEYIKQRFPLVEIIEGATDRGPATKLLGLIEYNNTAGILRNNDLLIVVDDDMLYSRDLVASHTMCYHLYGCDVVAVSEDHMIRTWHPYTFNVSDTFYLDHYNGFLYGWLSFGVTYGALKIKNDIERFYDDVVKQFPDVFYHDDLLFSLYAYRNKLYAVENRFVTLYHDLARDKDLYKVNPGTINQYNLKGRVYDARTKMDSVNPLRDMILGSGKNKYDLEDEVYQFYQIPLIGKSYRFRDTEYQIPRFVGKRDISLVNGLKLISWPEDIHVSFVYLDQQSAIMTVTVFDDSLAGTDAEITFSIDNTKYSVIISIETTSGSGGTIIDKFSHVMYFANQHISPKPYSNPRGLTVIQTNTTANVSKNKYNAMMTVLINSPEFPYEFYDDQDVVNFVSDNYTQIIVDALQNLVPGAYVSDLFRYCYLYLNGGIYMDCKKVVYVPVCDYIDDFMTANSSTKITDIFIKDKLKNYAYNAIMVCDKFSKVTKIALVYSVYKIVNNNYDIDPLCVTGPGCLGDAVDYMYGNRYPYYYFNYVPPGKQDLLSFVGDKSKSSVIKNSYFGYYEEGGYKDTGHYHNLWMKHKIYKTDLSSKYKNIKKMSDIVLFKK